MKLIDLLVKELPKRGGWPDGSILARKDDDMEICFQGGGTESDFFAEEMSEDSLRWLNENNRATSDLYVTRGQYEIAIAKALGE